MTAGILKVRSFDWNKVYCFHSFAVRLQRHLNPQALWPEQPVLGCQSKAFSTITCITMASPYLAVHTHTHKTLFTSVWSKNLYFQDLSLESWVQSSLVTCPRSNGLNGKSRPQTLTPFSAHTHLPHFLLSLIVHYYGPRMFMSPENTHVEVLTPRWWSMVGK
jgi:hypothetical protein